MNTAGPTYCVTLVHGTFAPNAPWTNEGSNLRKTLQERLGGAVRFTTHNWGGANSQSARLDAAKKLERHLWQQMQESPNSAHFVIAHSHGGNVALMACNSQCVAEKLKGIVCLATPFLSYKPRRYRLVLRLLLYFCYFYVLTGQ